MRVLSAILILTIAGVAGGLAITYSAKQQPDRGVGVEDLAELFRPETKHL